MAPNLRSVRKLCAGICLCTALVSIQRVHAQTPCSDARPEIGLQTPRDTQEANGGFGENPPPGQLHVAFEAFLRNLSREDRNFARDIAHGQNPPRAKTNWGRILFIACDKQAALLAIGAEANAKIDEIDAKLDEINGGDPTDPSYRTVSHTKEEQAAIKAIVVKQVEERDRFVDEAIAKFREALGEQGFDNLEAYIYRTDAWASRIAAAKAAQERAAHPSSPAAKEPQR